MNKLESIFYIQKLGLPTQEIFILSEDIEGDIRKHYYPSEKGWVIRCGEVPDFDAKRESHLPWNVANNEYDLGKKAYALKRKINPSYLIFIHPQRRLEKIGNMLILPSTTIIEGIKGGTFGLLNKFMVRGCDPDERLVYSPGMMSLMEKTGMDLFSKRDLGQLRYTERILKSDPNFPALVEFSISGGILDIHDLNIRARKSNLEDNLLNYFSFT